MGEGGADSRLVRDWGVVVRAVEGIQHGFAERLESMDMTLPYFSVLTLLLEADQHRMPMSRIARDLSMTSGGFTKLADRMARDGLIDRRGSSGDRRVVFAALTEAGAERARAAAWAYQQFLRDVLLPVVPEVDLQTLAGITGRLAAEGGKEAEPQNFEMRPRPPHEPDRRGGRG